MELLVNGNLRILSEKATEMLWRFRYCFGFEVLNGEKWSHCIVQTSLGHLTG